MFASIAMRCVRVILLSSAALALVASAVHAVEVYPSQLTFCASPLAPPPVDSPNTVALLADGAPNPLARFLPPTTRVEVSISNLRPFRPRPIIIKALSIDSIGIGAPFSENVFGIALSDLPVSPRVTIEQKTASNDPQRDPSGFSATTNCSDKVGNALSIPAGGNCKIFLTFRPQPTSGSRMLTIVTDDPERSVLTVPLLVSHAPNCTPPASVPFPLNVALGPFFPLLPGVIATPNPAKDQNCRCSYACNPVGDVFGTTDAHVVCHDRGNCDACCETFATWKCEGRHFSAGVDWQ